MKLLGNLHSISRRILNRKMDIKMEPELIEVATNYNYESEVDNDMNCTLTMNLVEEDNATVTNTIIIRQKKDEFGNNILRNIKQEEFDIKEESSDRNEMIEAIDVDLPASCTCCPVHKKKTNEHLKQIIRNQNILQSMMSQLMQDIRTLKESNSNNVIPKEVLVSIFNRFNFPLNEQEQLREFEDYLKVEENFGKAVEELSRIGGASPYDFIKRVLTKLISNELASEYSWYGLKKKQIFGKLALSQLVVGAGLKTIKAATTKDFEEGIKNWLRRAKERAIVATRRSILSN